MLTAELWLELMGRRHVWVDQCFLALAADLLCINVLIRVVKSDGSCEGKIVITPSQGAQVSSYVSLAYLENLHYCAIVPRNTAEDKAEWTSASEGAKVLSDGRCFDSRLVPTEAQMQAVLRESFHVVTTAHLLEKAEEATTLALEESRCDQRRLATLFEEQIRQAVQESMAWQGGEGITVGYDAALPIAGYTLAQVLEDAGQAQQRYPTKLTEALLRSSLTLRLINPAFKEAVETLNPNVGFVGPLRYFLVGRRIAAMRSTAPTGQKDAQVAAVQAVGAMKEMEDLYLSEDSDSNPGATADSVEKDLELQEDLVLTPEDLGAVLVGGEDLVLDDEDLLLDGEDLERTQGNGPPPDERLLNPVLGPSDLSQVCVS